MGEEEWRQVWRKNGGGGGGHARRMLTEGTLTHVGADQPGQDPANDGNGEPSAQRCRRTRCHLLLHLVHRATVHSRAQQASNGSRGEEHNESPNTIRTQVRERRVLVEHWEEAHHVRESAEEHGEGDCQHDEEEHHVRGNVVRAVVCDPVKGTHGTFDPRVFD